MLSTFFYCYEVLSENRTTKRKLFVVSILNYIVCSIFVGGWCSAHILPLCFLFFQYRFQLPIKMIMIIATITIIINYIALIN